MKYKLKKKIFSSVSICVKVACAQERITNKVEIHREQQLTLCKLLKPAKNSALCSS